MADKERVTTILGMAREAVDAAELPDDLRVVAFDKAVDLLAGRETGAPKGPPPPADMTPDQDAATFFSTHGGKPHENALAIAAYFYSQYGSSPFSYDDVKKTAGEVGMTIPDRLDMTLGHATRDGKRLFKASSRGSIQPTVHGETWMRSEYSITKGTKQRAA